MATSAILNHQAAAQSLAAQGTPMAAGVTANAGSSASSTDSATISANDFLTLLVTEMQNQDPTAQTDPNEYINQLVQVNSLEQLISINQDLTPATTSNSSGSAASGAVTASVANPVTSNASTTTANTTAAQSSALDYAPGNLSIPNTSAASQRVAHALDGQAHPLHSRNGFPGM